MHLLEKCTWVNISCTFPLPHHLSSHWTATGIIYTWCASLQWERLQDASSNVFLYLPFSHHRASLGYIMDSHGFNYRHAGDFQIFILPVSFYESSREHEPVVDVFFICLKGVTSDIGNWDIRSMLGIYWIQINWMARVITTFISNTLSSWNLGKECS